MTWRQCAKCRKACWSPDCLTGMRCCWCGLTVHTSCLATVPEELQTCRFGCLEPIFLPPSAVSIPRTQVTYADQQLTLCSLLLQCSTVMKIFYPNFFHYLAQQRLLNQSENSSECLQISQVNFIGVKAKESNVHNLYRLVDRPDSYWLVVCYGRSDDGKSLAISDDWSSTGEPLPHLTQLSAPTSDLAAKQM